MLSARIAVTAASDDDDDNVKIMFSRWKPTLSFTVMFHVVLPGGTHGVMVIVVGRVQILDETDCISYSTNTLGKDMNPIILPPAMGK